MSGRDVVCVGFADWETDLWTNQHHLMARLAARGDRVLFVESLGLRRPTLARRDVARIARRLRRGVAPPRRCDGVDVLSPLVVPLHSVGAVRAVNARVLAGLVRRAAGRLGFRRPVLWGYVPQAGVLLDALSPSRVVYHCVDDIAAQSGIDAASFRAAENSFARRADLVLASSPNLTARMRELNATVHYAPNVADTALFATALEDGPVDAALAALPGPRIVFTGAVGAAQARLRVARRARTVAPVMVDRTRRPRRARRPAHRRLADWRPSRTSTCSACAATPSCPRVLRGADAAIIPYRRSQLTDSIFPMKVYEYLAAGLGVVATELPALEGVAGIERRGDAAAFADALDTILATDSPARAPRTQRAGRRPVVGRAPA